MSNEEILECLKTDIKLRGLSQNTSEEYGHRVRIFMAYFERPEEQLDEVDVKEFLLYLLDQQALNTLLSNQVLSLCCTHGGRI